MSGNGNVSIRELKHLYLIMKRFQDWQRWKLSFPLFTLLVVYPLYKFFGVGNELINAFSHGDLLLFSALVLIELSVEAAHVNKEVESGVSDPSNSLIENSRFFGLVLIFLYGVTKFMVQHQNNADSFALSKTLAYCAFSLSVTFLVVAFSIFAFWKTLRNVITKSNRTEN